MAKIQTQLPEHYRIALGTVIRELRKQRGWRLYNVRKRTGVSQGHLSHLELGKQTGGPSLGTLLKLCDAFGITVPALLATVEARIRGRLVEADAPSLIEPIIISPAPRPG